MNNLPISGKFIISPELNAKEIASRIATIMISFNENIIVDYKTYEKLKIVSVIPENQTEQMVLKINSDSIKVIIYFSPIDSDYLYIDKLIYLNGNGRYRERSDLKENFLFISED